MVKHKLTKEPDVFLGEKVIEVRRVGAPRDVWYKLGKYLCMASLFSIHNYCTSPSAQGRFQYFVYVGIYGVAFEQYE